MNGRDGLEYNSISVRKSTVKMFLIFVTSKCGNNWYIFCREVLAALKEKHDTNHSMIATAFHNLAVINSDQVLSSVIS